MDDLIEITTEANLYRLDLNPREILVVTIPAQIFYSQSNKVQNISKIAKRLLEAVDLDNPIFIIPDDWSIGKISPSQIDPEPEGFDKDDFTL
jgi:hypothetical protein